VVTVNIENKSDNIFLNGQSQVASKLAGVKGQATTKLNSLGLPEAGTEEFKNLVDDILTGNSEVKSAPVQNKNGLPIVNGNNTAKEEVLSSDGEQLVQNLENAQSQLTQLKKVNLKKMSEIQGRSNEGQGNMISSLEGHSGEQAQSLSLNNETEVSPHIVSSSMAPKVDGNLEVPRKSIFSVDRTVKQNYGSSLNKAKNLSLNQTKNESSGELRVMDGAGPVDGQYEHKSMFPKQQVQSQESNTLLNKNNNKNADQVFQKFSGRLIKPEAAQAEIGTADVLKLKNNFKSSLKGPKKVMPYKQAQNLSQTNIFAGKNIQSGDVGLQNISQLNSSSPGASEFLSVVENNQDISIPMTVTPLNIANNKYEGQVQVAQNNEVLDMSNINTDDKQKIITEISNYIEKRVFETSDELEILVKHDSLGGLKIHVKKMPVDNAIDLKIESGNKFASNFFEDNKAALVQDLTSAGLKLSDVKIVLNQSGLELKSQDFKSSEDSSFNGSKEEGSHSHHQQKHNSKDKDSQRRSMLWENYKERMAS
jgi:hypothetical protein